LATSAGLAMLNLISEQPDTYAELEKKGKFLKSEIEKQLVECGLNYTVNQIGSMFTLFFTNQKVQNFSDAKTSDTVKFGQYFHTMLKQGVYLPPSQYESWFLSTALEESHLDQILSASRKALQTIH
jgi:glutamate-1-semialdehyde 2,1-aminomutase